MTPEKFINTVYIGDRGFKSILIDGWNEIAKIKITCISRMTGGVWNFYTDEDLLDGQIVFCGLKQAKVEPLGCIPNSYIEVTSAKEINESLFEFKFSVGALSAEGGVIMATIEIISKSLHLEDCENNIINWR